jgi:hypothetical protein
VDAGALPPGRIRELRSPEIKTFDAATGAKTPSSVTPSNEGMQKRLSDRYSSPSAGMLATTLRARLGATELSRRNRYREFVGVGVLPSERTLIGRR